MPAPLDFARDERAVVTVSEALTAAAAKLALHSATPRLDAELLMAHALGIDRQELLRSHLQAETPLAFNALLVRRAAGEPVAYIEGRRGFWTIELEVGPGVLIPRPDSETLLEAALAHFRTHSPQRILDLGTGPGTLLLAALDQWPAATGLGIDASEEALAYARRNATSLGLAPRAEFRRGDWAQGVTETFDLILCNPPYVETTADLPRDVRDFEPHEALFAGADGLDDYRRIAPMLTALLSPHGIACIEVGAGQADMVASLFEATGLATHRRNDLGGYVRCVAVTP
jgi:release factor glutamine methyltransferase